MRSKTPLILIEQTIMILVFSLAAAICLRAFSLSDRISMETQDQGQALLCVQSAAETLKNGSGSLENRAAYAAGLLDGYVKDSGLTIYYNEAWIPVSSPSSYRLTAAPLSTAYPDMGAARIQVVREGSDASPLYGTDIAWQEVTGCG